MLAKGVVEEDDVSAELRSLREARSADRDALADLAEPSPIPRLEEVDIDAFRAAVLTAWAERPLDDRRGALGQLIERIELTPDASGKRGEVGEAVVYSRWGATSIKNQGQSPFGPRSGTRYGSTLALIVEGLGVPKERAA